MVSKPRNQSDGEEEQKKNLGPERYEYWENLGQFVPDMRKNDNNPFL